MAERSKAVRSGRIPKGRGFEPHFRQTFWNFSANKFTLYPSEVFVNVFKGGLLQESNQDLGVRGVSSCGLKSFDFLSLNATHKTTKPNNNTTTQIVRT